MNVLFTGTNISVVVGVQTNFWPTDRTTEMNYDGNKAISQQSPAALPAVGCRDREKRAKSILYIVQRGSQVNKSVRKITSYPNRPFKPIFEHSIVLFIFLYLFKLDKFYQTRIFIALNIKIFMLTFYADTHFYFQNILLFSSPIAQLDEISLCRIRRRVIQI